MKQINTQICINTKIKNLFVFICLPSSPPSDEMNMGNKGVPQSVCLALWKEQPVADYLTILVS